MKLRLLEQKDAPLMLEWMHDADCVENLQANFSEKTLADCQRFIQASQDTSETLNMAIVDDNDEYMGTVSLKHIDMQLKTAEFAIATRRCSMGKGFAAFGMKAIIEKGLHELGLDTVVWCVSPLNKRAVRFYDKNGWQRVPADTVRTDGYTPEQVESLIWYCATK